MLQEESKLPGKLNYRSSTPANEMHDSDIANADDELKGCKVALEVWACLIMTILRSRLRPSDLLHRRLA